LWMSLTHRLMTPEEALSSEISLRGPAPDSQLLLNAINAFVKEGASSAAAVCHSMKTEKRLGPWRWLPRAL
jgi:hypothetical protein